MTAVALDETGTLLGSRRFAVEGATGLGRPIALLLAGGGDNVVDVPFDVERSSSAARDRRHPTRPTWPTRPA